MGSETLGDPSKEGMNWEAPKTGSEGIKKQEVKKVSEYDQFTNELESKLQEEWKQEDENTKKKYEREGREYKVTDSHTEENYNKNQEKWQKENGYEPNFCPPKLLLPFEIDGKDLGNLASKVGEASKLRTFESYKEAYDQRQKMFDTMEKAGISEISEIKNKWKSKAEQNRGESGYGQYFNDGDIKFADNADGKKLYNIQIKYANLTEGVRRGIVKQEQVVPMLEKEYKKMGAKNQ